MTANFPSNQPKYLTGRRETGHPHFMEAIIFSTTVLFSISLLGLLIQIQQLIKCIWWRWLSCYQQNQNVWNNAVRWKLKAETIFHQKPVPNYILCNGLLKNLNCAISQTVLGFCTAAKTFYPISSDWVTTPGFSKKYKWYTNTHL